MEKQKRVKILYVVESFSTGVYVVIRNISINLDPDIYQFHIIHSLRPDSPKTYREDFACPHITLEYVDMGSWKNYFSAMRKIRKTITAYSPDIIHLHSSKAGFLGRIAAKSKAKIFYSPHGFSFLRVDVGRVKRGIFFLLEKMIILYAGGVIIAVSNGELQEAKRISKHVVLIENFIDLSHIPAEDESEKPLIVTSGRISSQKNPKLFNELAASLPEYSFQWLGDGLLRDTLTAKNIEITGFLDRKEVLTLLSKAWIYIQTSLWEGMPISVLEAMGAAKPVVATDIIGNRDLIKNEETGFLINAIDVNGFVQMVRNLIEDANLRSSIGQAAKKYLVTNHDAKRAVKMYAALYINSKNLLTE
jgi:glycosyltransferase involved in cell wall biosynthesis